MVEILQILSELLDAVSHEFFILLGAVRRDKDIWEVPELGFIREGLDFEDVEDGAADDTFFESLGQILLMHSGSSANIHENGCFLHFGEGGFHVEEVPSISDLREHTDNEVSLLDDSLVLVVADDLVAVGAVEVGAVGRIPLDTPNLHSEAILGNLGAGSPNVAVPDDGHRLVAHELHGLDLPFLFRFSLHESLHMLRVEKNAECDELAEDG